MSMGRPVSSSFRCARTQTVAIPGRCRSSETERVVYFRKPLAPALETPARRVG
jgi:hypothetical protein